MIRYVLAVVLTVALIAASTPVMEHAAGYHSERIVDAELHELVEAADELDDADELPPPGQLGAQRTVELQYPGDSRVSQPVAYVEIEPTGNGSVLRFAIQGRSTVTRAIDARVVSSSNGTVELGGVGETETIVLTYQRDGSHSPVVVVRRLQPDAEREAGEPVQL